MGFLDDGVAYLNDVLDDQTASDVTYQRGGQSATVSATPGVSVFELDSEFGVLRIESRDYLVTASGLAAFGEPRRGDRIIESQSGQDVIHEVLEQSGVPPFKYSDAGRLRYRIHTKRISV